MAPALGKSWLEIPAAMDGSEMVMMEGSNTENLFTHTFYYNSTADATDRNYTVCYDTQALTTLWVAYPLNSSHLGGSYGDSSWAYVDSSLLPYDCQANVKGGSYYLNSVNNYSRGHLVPDASRTTTKLMNEQTFVSVNSVPQIQSNFNSGVWSTLEGELRKRVTSANESLYIVTGTMCPQANDGNGTITMEATYDKDNKQIPAPRYFYKVVLKVDNEENPTSAQAIGFWYTNQAHSGGYADSGYIKSVDQIEELTGLDFFVNLPDKLEATAEAQTSKWW